MSNNSELELQNCYLGTTQYLSCKYLLNKNFILNALKSYYYNKITKAGETELYFKNYGGDKWKEKLEISKPFKEYNEFISGDNFKKELNIIIFKCIEDLSKLIENEYNQDEIKNLTLNDIYYTYEQVYLQIKNNNTL